MKNYYHNSQGLKRPYATLILFKHCLYLQITNTGGPKQWAQLNGKAVEQDGMLSVPVATSIC